ncbi:MAG: aerotolerance regulator BatA [Nitrospinae bacterium CG11_big_fil_rev_8_21_14_0_20_56_8]|nr:MAG: aerotolerance regulator BatA [Nitrospinae bacterium CG11_big_fil_rev_8_21_14_0_20_56_8]
MTFYQFNDPWLLLFLFAVPVLVTLNRTRRPAAIRYSSVLPARLSRSEGADLRAVIPRWLRYAALILLVLALARPQEGQRRHEILSRGVDIVLALDTSGSMQALDLSQGKEPVNRLDVVRKVVEEFIGHRPNDRIGMVVFGAEAYTQCPLTLDHNVLKSFLDKVSIGIAGDSTAIGSALGVAVKRLKDLDSKSKVIILLTDGLNNAGSLTPVQAAEIAKTFGIKVYAVGVGTRGKAPFLVDTFFGKKYVYQDVEIDEETLKQVAGMTGGQYFRATDYDSLKHIYEQIDRMEKSEVKVQDFSEYREMFPWFLVPALLLALLESALSNTLLRKIP